jgi:UDP-glucose 4-epimerase
LIVGGLGFIGSAITKKLVDKGDEVLVVDDLSYGKRENLVKGAAFKYMSARKLASLKWKADRLFHFGSHSSIMHCFKDPVGTSEDTIAGWGGVLRYGKKTGARMVMASSATVYGNAPLPQRESGSTYPVNQYAIAKLLCEKMAKGSGAALLRIFSGYGPGEMEKTWYKSPVGMFLEDARLKRPFTIFGDGSQTRDFVHVDDIAEAAVRISETSFQGPLNVGTGKQTSILQLSGIVAMETGIRWKARHEPKFDDYVDRMQADVFLLSKLLPGIRFRSIEEGVSEWVSTSIEQL